MRFARLPAGQAIQKEVGMSKSGLVVIAGLLLLVSSAFGLYWQQLTSGTSAELMSVHFPEGTQVGYAVGVDMDSLGGEVGSIIKTTDGGTTWVPQASGATKALKSVYFKDDSNGFAVGSAGTAIRTTDGGVTWNPFTVPITDDLTNVQFPESGPIGYIIAHPRSGPPSKTLKTTDGGENWTAIYVGGPASVTRGGCFANDSVGVIVGDDGLVLGTTDGLGSTHYQGPQTTADLVAVAFSSEEPSKGYLIGYDSTQGLIRYTDDGGATLWDSVRVYPTTAFFGVDMPSEYFAFVCGTGGFIGITWSSPRDVWRQNSGVTTDLHGLCFPNGPDTGYAVGAAGTVLRTDEGSYMPHWVTEGNGRVTGRVGIRVVSNPSRRGITFRADANVNVVVFDAAGRVVVSRAATKGLDFLPLSDAGVYFVHEAQAQAQAHAVHKVVISE
jgi:photosystem II stability/assembly factor-like uncharacterized protein